MAKWRAELWDDLEANGGTRLAVLQPLVQGSARMQVDGNDSLNLTVESSTVWNALLDVSRVVRTVSPQGTPIEWVVSGVERSRGRAEGEVAVEGLPLITRLGDIGQMRSQSTGGQAWHNLGGVGLTPQQYIETFAIPSLQTFPGTTAFEVGTVDPVGQYDIAWDRWPPLQLLRQLESRTGAELVLRRISSTGYAIDLLAERGSTVARRLLRVGRNMLELQESRRTDTFRTVVQPAGLVPNGAVESASIAYAAWLVAAGSSSQVTLADPSSIEDPIQFNDQVTGCYLLLPDASLTPITSSSTTQVVKVASATAVSSGEHVEVRASSAGQWLYELSNPSVASSSAFGRIVAVLEDATLRGERNHIRNSLATDWTSRPDITPCLAAGGTGGMLVNELPTSGFAIKAGDVVLSGRNGQAWRIGADVTATSSGGATLSIGGALSSGAPMLLSRQAARYPAGWTPDGSTAGAHIMVATRDVTSAATLAGNVDGNQTLQDGTLSVVALKNLTAGAVLQAGDHIVRATDYLQVASAATVAVGGTVSVTVYPKNLALNDNDAITISQPGYPEGPKGLTLVDQYTGNAGVGAAPWVQSPIYTVRYDSSIPVLWASVYFTLYGAGAGATLKSDGTTNYYPPWMRLVDGTGTSLASIADADRTITAGQSQSVLMRVQYVPTTNKTVAIRFGPPRYAGGVVVPPGRVSCVVHWVSVTLGPDPDVPHIEGSHANALWRRGNVALKEVAQDPGTYTVRLRDLAASTDYDPANESLELGATVRLYDATLGLDRAVRIMGVTADLVDSGNTQVELAAIRPKITDMMANAAKMRVPMFIDVSGTTSTAAGGGGGGTGNPLSTAPQGTVFVGEVDPGNPGGMPPGQPGAPRSTAPPGGGSTGQLPINPYHPPE